MEKKIGVCNPERCIECYWVLELDGTCRNRTCTQFKGEITK